MDTKSIDRTTAEGEGAITKIESLSRPGHVHFVSPDLTACSCEATILCRHIRIVRVRAAKKRLAALQHRFHNELMGEEERCELRDEILRLKRRAA